MTIDWNAPLEDLSELYERLLSGSFYDDYDEDARLMGVLGSHVERIRTQTQDVRDDKGT